VEALRAAVQRCTDGRMTVTRTLAERDGADAAIDREVRLVHRTLTAIVKTNPRSRLLQTYFPDGSYAITSAHPTREVGLVDAILAKIETEAEPHLAALKEPLRAAQTAYRAAVDAHDAAQQALRTAVELEHAARLQWFADYQSMFHDLSARFIDDPARVETYFKSPKTALSKEDEDEDGADDSNGTGTGTGTGAGTGSTSGSGTATPAAPALAASGVADAPVRARSFTPFDGDGLQGELNT
jgi:hypothetical protein